MLIPLDGSPLAEGIIPFILDMAGPLGMDIVLLRVVSPVLSQTGHEAAPVMIDDMTARIAEARDYLATIAADLVERRMHVQTRVRGGTPRTEILAAAREVSANLIAMTTHGRSGFGRLLFGSVAEAVLRQGEFPVFLMRLTERTVRHEPVGAKLRWRKIAYTSRRVPMYEAARATPQPGRRARRCSVLQAARMALTPTDPAHSQKTV